MSLRDRAIQAYEQEMNKDRQRVLRDRRLKAKRLLKELEAQLGVPEDEVDFLVREDPEVPELEAVQARVEGIRFTLAYEELAVLGTEKLAVLGTCVDCGKTAVAEYLHEGEALPNLGQYLLEREQREVHCFSCEAKEGVA